MIIEQNSKSILVTGGAGFIGANLVEALLQDPRVAKVRVLDNLSTGYTHNIEEFLDNPRFEFMEGDIRDFETCLKACTDMQLVSHQAALGSVPRSINDPLNSNAVNVDGTLNIFYAAVKLGIDRVVFASSSSTYGDNTDMPKVESHTGAPLSPYAGTKKIGEIYADIFQKTYGLRFIGLRYFNIFGPKQNILGPYAAVIPLFITQLLKDEAPVINGDGTQSRDFTYVQNAVQANMLSLFTESADALNQVYNVACSDTTSLNEMYDMLLQISGKNIKAIHGPSRNGDIKDSLADISKARNLLGYEPGIKIREGLINTLNWFKKHN